MGGGRARGGALGQVRAGPSTVILWSLAGAVVICLVWAWWRFGPTRVKAQEHEADLLRQEADVKALGDFRTRPPPKSRRPPR